MSLTFHNRTDELDALERAWTRPLPGGQFALLYGRRRLGKTYLLQHFFADKPHAYHLADQSTPALQRLALAQTLLEALPDEGITPEEIAQTWNTLLRFLTHSLRGRQEHFGLILDEFPYLIQQTPELPSILQAWWDKEGGQLPLFLVLCGSQLSTMMALGAQTAPLFGRFNAGVLKLEPLTYGDSTLFYEEASYTTAEKLTLYGMLGGTPRYHALLDRSQPLSSAICDLILRPGSPLESEVQFLLGSEQIRDPAPYHATLTAIARGRTQAGQIADVTGIEVSGLSYYLNRLVELDWIQRSRPFDERSDRRALWEIRDPFLTFWYRLVHPRQSALAFTPVEFVWTEQLAPQLSVYMGQYVFEKICHQWLRKQGRAHLGVTILEAGRWWSRNGQIELDVVARLDSGTFLFGECKWAQAGPVGVDVYTTLVGKVMQLPEVSWREHPRYVLFSGSGFTPELEALAADPTAALQLVGARELL
ncbi:DUF234 domain-containing protein [Armatimonas sp.]|uniref:DUF234 domain-containing protein n=1 Tax=Armatimonas sp. TaxID=1872638 RepID=UPI003750028F